MSASVVNVAARNAGSRSGVQRTGMQRARRVLLIAAGALAVWSVAAWAAARALVVQAELTQADAIVVLSGSSAYIERARHAARLWHEGRAPLVVLTNDTGLSGWSSAEQRNPLFVERAAAELRRAGVPPERIAILGPPVASTHEEAVALREQAAARGLRSMLVVTSAYHSRRAWRTWERVFAGSGVRLGLDPVAPGEQTPGALTWWLSPGGWRMVAGEYPKLVYYWWQYSV